MASLRVNPALSNFQGVYAGAPSGAVALTGAGPFTVTDPYQLTAAQRAWAMDTKGDFVRALGDAARPTLECFGHSIIAGAGLGDVTLGLGGRLVARGAFTGAQYGVGGSILASDDELATGSAVAGSWVTAARSHVLGNSSACMWGLNDLAKGGAPLLNLMFKHSLRATLAHLSAAAEFIETDSTVSYPVGSWAFGASTTYNSGVGTKFCFDAAGTVRVATGAGFPGGRVTMRFVAPSNTTGANFTQLVDAVSYQTLDMTPATTAAGRLAGDNAAFCLRTAVLTPGSHTIDVSFTGGTGGVFFDSWTYETTPPQITVIGQYKYADYSPMSFFPIPVTASLIDTLNSAQQQVCLEFPNARYVSLESLGNIAPAQLQGDGIHPLQPLYSTIASLALATVDPR